MILTETFERQKLYAFAAEFLRSKGAKMVLDMACGEGVGSFILSKKISSVRGVDISRDLINSAKSKFSVSNVEFSTGDARKTEFGDSSFDGVVSCHTLEHFNSPDQILFLRELKRITKPGGSIIIATPDKDVWRLQGIAGMQEDHIKELTRSEAEDLLGKIGLKIAGVFGQEILKSKGIFLRKALNLIKRMDIFKIRRLISDNLIASVDEGTQPVKLTGEVVPLRAAEKASIIIFICERV